MKDGNNKLLSCWSIAGFDPSCLSGIAADLKTFQTLNVSFRGIPTAWTFQNQNHCFGWEALTPEQIKNQIEALREEGVPQVIKIGMIGAKKTAELLAELFHQYREGVGIFSCLSLAPRAVALRCELAAQTAASHVLHQCCLLQKCCGLREYE